jgi:AraC family transcriptional regulator of adaptative response/methylated-DNA-[protein]-cysteine methyltransferase
MDTEMDLRELDPIACYTAICRRDERAEGRFFVGVKTMGVFCRPTCPAPPPKRENCEYFASAEQALGASYRPCKRCKPLSPPNAASEVIRRLVEAVDKNPLKRWRAEDLARLNTNAATARRQFKARFGMSFADYARARRLGEAFKAIRSGERVINAQLDAGYESASGLREAFSKLMHKGPSSSSAAKLLFASWFDTPIGPVVAVADHVVLYLLEYADRSGLDGQFERLRRRADAGIVPGLTSVIDQIQGELLRYFEGRLTKFETKLARLGTPFQQSAWDALTAIPAGSTRSYGEIARVVGRASAVRAVAQANGANPFAIVVPCHRVVAADGKLGGYGGGVWRKQWLLEHERRFGAAKGRRDA